MRRSGCSDCIGLQVSGSRLGFCLTGPSFVPGLLCCCSLTRPVSLAWRMPGCSEEQGEVALVIRGTFSPEDAFFDLLANGAPRGCARLITRPQMARPAA